MARRILKRVPLDALRESADLKLGIVKRMAKEPPSRYSHLIGRYLRTDDLRAQYVAERIYKDHALGLRRGGGGEGGAGGAGGAGGGDGAPAAGDGSQ